MKLFLTFVLAVVYFNSTGQTLAPYRLKNGNYIFVDSASMKPILTKEYKDANMFNEGLAAVMVDDKWGFIDKKGIEVIAPLYRVQSVYKFEPINQNSGFESIKIETTKPFFQSDGTASVTLNGNDIIIDKTGKLLEPKDKPAFDISKYYAVGPFVEGLAQYRIKKNDIVKIGFIDKKGKEITEAIYDEACDFNQGLALVKKNYKFQFIDNTGKNKFSEEYNDAFDFFDGLALVKGDSLCWYMDRAGKKVVIAGPATPLEIESMTHSGIGLKTSVQTNYRKHFYSPFINGFALVRRTVGVSGLNFKWKIIDKTNKEYPLEAESDTLLLPGSIYGVIKFVKNGKVGLINYRGKVVAPPIYDNIETFINGEALYVSGRNYGGFIDFKGQITHLPDDIGIIGIAKLDPRKTIFFNGFAEIIIQGVGNVYIDKAGRVFREK